MSDIIHPDARDELRKQELLEACEELKRMYATKIQAASTLRERLVLKKEMARALKELDEQFKKRWEAEKGDGYCLYMNTDSNTDC